MATAAATVVYVARDRWAQAPVTLDALLAATDSRHPVVVVDGGAAAPIARALDARASERVRVARTNRFLGSNEARNIGAEGANTEWVAFVENDVVLSDGWLDTLIAAGERLDAHSVYPVYLENRSHGGPVIHGLGCDIDVYGSDGARHVRERNHCIGKPWAEVRSTLEPVQRPQAEPHAIVVRRELLDRLGGLDEGLTGWFEHVDLALHHLRLSASAWLVPDVTCMYLAPPPVAVRDMQNFSLRWGRELYDASLHHLCRTWGLDPSSPEWQPIESYRHAVRRRALRRLGRLRGVVERATAPIDRVVAKRWTASRQRGPDRAPT